MNLRSHRALVTGGAIRIGRAICRALALRGCDVAIHYRRSKSAAKALAEELRGYGVRAWLVNGTLDTEKECRRIFAAAWKVTKGFDILINNAAVFHRERFLDITERKLWNELQANLVAPLVLTRLLARRILTQPSASGRPQQALSLPARSSAPAQCGNVVNLLDCRITANKSGCLAYLLSKKMLAAATLDLALELAPYLRINAVAPGPVLPPRQHRGATAKVPAGPIPLKTQCTPEQVAQAVIFLLEADAVTGQIIFVDGGQHLLGSEREESCTRD